MPSLAAGCSACGLHPERVLSRVEYLYMGAAGYWHQSCAQLRQARYVGTSYVLLVRLVPSQGMAGRPGATFFGCWLLRVRPAAPERLHLVPVGTTESVCTYRGCWRCPASRLHQYGPLFMVRTPERLPAMFAAHSQRLGQPKTGLWAFMEHPLGHWPSLVWDLHQAVA